MKYFSLVLLAICFISSCDQKKTGYRIVGEAKDIENGTKVYINAISQSNRPSIVDSTEVQDGRFTFDLPDTSSSDFNYINFPNIPGNIIFLPENQEITMTVYKDSLRSSKVVGGSENELFFTYVDKLNNFGKRKEKIGTDFQVASKLGENDKVLKYREELKSIDEEEKAFRKNLAKEYPNSIVSVMVLTDLMNLKALPAREIKKLYTAVPDTLKKSRLGKNLDMMIASSIGKIDVGSESEDFTAPTPDGSKLTLHDNLGKITILDFWASWCRPCRIENPNVVRIYNKYHDKGLNIVGVSLDRKKEQWISAIDQDNLEWNHVSNLQFWQDPIAKTYGVRSIPATFILDENGKVIAKNLRGPALESKIAEILGETSESTL
ncbi:AhpC/TSA family protein [Aquimarina sp. ERC-38]|uniref:TlpA disulfide reductase family protein n=1 Tax=Aquimarina sp. ERC-38 TaxID=2949996 RepID=UPI002245C626|nr:TlpA disulfide reductase family protein [Aquimarina sp. ERC-38]UZO79864.1 AhpC/TSA family protein [Aquimarina sp. ERC-38]